jgi:hypothetical protein
VPQAEEVLYMNGRGRSVARRPRLCSLPTIYYSHDPQDVMQVYALSLIPVVECRLLFSIVRNHYSSSPT